MQKINKCLLLITTVLIITFLSSCAKKDLILDFGEGGSIRLVGRADNFFCDDPAYANVKKVQTSTLQFYNGTTKYLCAPEDSGTTTGSTGSAGDSKLNDSSNITRKKIIKKSDLAIEEQ